MCYFTVHTLYVHICNYSAQSDCCCNTLSALVLLILDLQKHFGGSGNTFKHPLGVAFKHATDHEHTKKVLTLHSHFNN